MTLLLVVLVFGGMIFLHELGHYLAARLFKIEVEEFGFGIPPRLWRFWRTPGSFKVGMHSIQIPANFDLPVDVTELEQRPVDLVLERKGESLTLKAMTLSVAEADRYVLAHPTLTPGNDGALRLSGMVRELRLGTEFTLNWLPLGGFVRPKGEGDPDVPGGLAAASPWQRLAVLFAGPAMNLLTAVVVTAVIIGQMGVPVPGKVLIEDVTPDSPAQLAGIQPKDVIVSIAGTPVTSMDEARTMIRASLDQPLEMTLERDGQLVTLIATPLSSRSPEQGALGIGLSYPRREATLLEAIGGGFSYTGVQALTILYIPIGLIQGVIAPEEARLVGLKGIYDFFGQAVERDTESRQAASQPSGGASAATPPTPTNYVLSLIAMLSISLGVMNLLPIPALDGGRILFTLPEIIFRRRIPPRLENVINGVAFLLLIGLMLFVNLLDFINPANITLP
jgi:regulator of sigma E protease